MFLEMKGLRVLPNHVDCHVAHTTGSLKSTMVLVGLAGHQRLHEWPKQEDGCSAVSAPLSFLLAPRPLRLLPWSHPGDKRCLPPHLLLRCPQTWKERFLWKRCVFGAYSLPGPFLRTCVFNSNLKNDITFDEKVELSAAL